MKTFSESSVDNQILLSLITNATFDKIPIKIKNIENKNDSSTHKKIKSGINLSNLMYDIEKSAIILSLRNSTTKTQAAKALGINRTTLLWKMKKLNIENDFYDE